MHYKINAENCMAVERERERETFSRIGFICGGKNSLVYKLNVKVNMIGCRKKTENSLSFL